MIPKKYDRSDIFCDGKDCFITYSKEAERKDIGNGYVRIKYESIGTYKIKTTTTYTKVS